MGFWRILLNTRPSPKTLAVTKREMTSSHCRIDHIKEFASLVVSDESFGQPDIIASASLMAQEVAGNH